MYDEGAEASVVCNHFLPRLRVDTEGARKAQELQRGIEIHVTRLHSLRQARPLRFLPVLGLLAELYVRPVAADETVHVEAGLGVRADGLGSVLAELDELLDLLLIEIRGGDFLGDGGVHGLLAVILMDEVGSVTADANLGILGELGESDGARLARVDGALAVVHLLLEAVLTEIELTQIFQRVALAVCNLVERVLHFRGEPVLDEIVKVPLEELGDGKAGEGRHERRPLPAHVSPLVERGDDGCIGTRPADTLTLESLHEGGLGEACRRLGLVVECLEIVEIEGLSLGEVGKENFSVVERGIRVVLALDVDPQKAGKENTGAACAELALSRLYPGGHLQLLRVGHLRCEGALPDHVIEGAVLAGKGRLFGCPEGGPGRPDRLVGLLCARLRGELSRLLEEIVRAVALLHGAPGAADRFAGEMGRVGPHVGDEPLFVEALGDAHGVAGGETELAVCLLLEGGRDEGWRRAGCGLLLGNLANGPRGLPEALAELLRLFPAEYPHVLLCELAGGGIEVLAAGNPLALDALQLRLEDGPGRIRRRAQAGLEIPVYGLSKADALALALDDEPQAGRLHTPR